MRKHSVRKFIHAVLDCLPLLVIPIFAIYSQNHEINDNTLQVQENKVVDFNQMINYPRDGATSIGLTYNIVNDYIEISGTNTSGYSDIFTSFVSKLYLNHVYIITTNVLQNTNNCRIRIGSLNSSLSNLYDTNNGFTGLKQQRIKFGSQLNYNSFGIESLTSNTNYTGLQFTCNVYDLTIMFGEGNEPSLNDFNNLFQSYYYPYTESEEVVIENYETITYNDTDIMSQFMYVTYNAVDKYFNMNKVFNLGNIWTWVNNTLFGGQAPLSAFIVYNVIAYEFIMDIIFLIYLVLMWLIDWIECCIDRFLKKAS